MVLLFCQYQGRTGVSCPPLVLSGLALWVSTVGWPFCFPVVGPQFVGVGGVALVGVGALVCVLQVLT